MRKAFGDHRPSIKHHMLLLPLLFNILCNITQVLVA
jgi:hypothetical protein